MSASGPRRGQRLVLLGVVLLVGSVVAAGAAWLSDASAATDAIVAPSPFDPLLEDLERRTFHYFWDLSDPTTGLTPDRYPTPSFSSVAAVGFALTAYPIGIERGYVTREDAVRRTLMTLRFLLKAPQGSEPQGRSGYRGFFYHFLDMKTGTRYEDVELSTIDTAILLAGVLICREYFDGATQEEDEIRSVAEAIYRRVDWKWAQPRSPAICLGWRPESGFLEYDWRGYDESVILFVLALGSPTHATDAGAWPEYVRGYRWEKFQGQEYLAFAPLFGHQYSQIWIDGRGIQDHFMRTRGIDYFENSRRAALAHRAYATANPGGFSGYGENVWGLTACDGPADTTIEVGGRNVQVHTYWARGAGADEINDDGTIAPTAAAASIAFAPEVAIPAIKEMHRRYGRWLYSDFGFLDAFNPSFLDAAVPLRHGRAVPGTGWFDTDYIGIDQGPIVAMIENYRSGLIWRFGRRSPFLREGLRRAGFRGGWLDQPR